MYNFLQVFLDICSCKRFCSDFVKEIDVLLSQLPPGNQSSKLDSTVKELLSNLVDGREGEDLCLNSQMRRGKSGNTKENIHL